MGKQAYYRSLLLLADMFCPKVSLIYEVTVPYNRLFQSILQGNDSAPANLSLITD